MSEINKQNTNASAPEGTTPDSNKPKSGLAGEAGPPSSGLDARVSDSAPNKGEEQQ